MKYSLPKVTREEKMWNKWYQICTFMNKEKLQQRRYPGMVEGVGCGVLKLFCSSDFCVKVLRPSQPTRVMSSSVSLPNHIFS